MSFNSFNFLVFIAIVFPLYGALSFRWQNRMLLLASYIFYAFWDWRFLGLIVFSTVADFFIGLRIEGSTNERTRKRWLLLSLAMNLGILGFFKYYNFFTGNAAAVLNFLGLQVHPATLDIILPYGVSFYTFHEISYTVDVYRRERKAVRKLSTFAVFIAFFPQLVAGPIGRATNQLPQFENPRRMSWDGWTQGALLFFLGFFKKVAVADVLSPIAMQVFAEPSRCAPQTLLLGLYAFSLQIYADFSGYSDMARGLARVMGFELIQNFEQPYFSTNITAFWRRWHISLSTWLRDYLYIPLGGNRHGEAITYRNLFLTMFLGGLWHGASWTFAIWGSLHGLYLAAHKLLLRGRHTGSAGFQPADVGGQDGRAPRNEGGRDARDTAEARLVALLKVCGTFHLVAFAWIFFASKDFAHAFQFIRGLVFCQPVLDGQPLSFGADDLTRAGAAALALFVLIDLPQFLRREPCAQLHWRLAPRVALFTLLSLWLLLDRGMRDVPFIYFQF